MSETGETTTTHTDAGLEREFGDLIAAVQAQRPKIDPGFAARLDERVARPRARRECVTGWRPSGPMLGGLATAAVTLAVAIPVAHDVIADHGAPATTVTDQSARIRSTGGATAGPEAGPAASGDARVAPEPAIGGSALPGRRDRRVERSASVTLSAPSDKIEDTADQVVRVTDDAGGIVVNSNVSSGDDATGEASFDLRIPTARLQGFLRALSQVAHVKARSQGTTDVTGAAVSAIGRLADARAERKSLLRLLANAKTTNETEAIRDRLRIAAQEIATARAGVVALRERTSESTVSVSVETDDSAASSHDGAKWSLGDAWRDTKDVLTALAGGALVGLALLLPALLLGLLARLGFGRAARRRRESALGSPS
jgi:hypothetical protein